MRMSKSAKASVGPCSPRIITARFNSKGRKITLINCYAPTNDTTDEIKQEFYESLQGGLDHTPQRDIKTLIRNLKAEIDSVNTGRERIMRRHGLGCINDNGKRFANLFAFNDLVISGSVSPTKPSIKPHGSLLMVHHPTKLTVLQLAESGGEALWIRELKAGRVLLLTTISC